MWEVGVNKIVGIIAILMLTGCEPENRTPGLWLSGTLQPFPDDWGFVQDHREIAIEVATPYFIPHSVTIWCADFQGDLYVGAAVPDTKNWPGWVMDDPDVVLKVGDDIYQATLTRVSEPQHIDRVRSVYAAKYDLEPQSDYIGWIWSVGPRVSLDD